MKGEQKKIVFLTKNAKETRKTAGLLAEEIIQTNPHLSHALVIGLVGELGSGKTTFAQGFAKELGVKENVLSPTFVLVRQYSLQKKIFKKFIHIDCYRLEDPKELDALGWDDLAADPKNIILIEWADRVADLLLPVYITLSFRHINETSRTIIAEAKKA